MRDDHVNRRTANVAAGAPTARAGNRTRDPAIIGMPPPGPAFACAIGYLGRRDLLRTEIVITCFYRPVLSRLNLFHVNFLSFHLSIL